MAIPTNKKILMIAAVLAVISVFFWPFNADAQAPGIEVTTNGLPFNSTNLAPGRSVSATITVKNNQNKSHQAQIKGENLFDPAELASQMTLKITGDGVSHSNQFSRIFSQEDTLSKIPSGESRTYNLTLTLSDEAPQQPYEGKSLSFDLVVALDDCNTSGCEVAVSSGGASGGGSSSGRMNLLIFNERGIAGTPVENSAQITWNTNKPATSQVIYGPAGSSYTLDLNAPNFGYPYATLETTFKTSGHSVVLSGLLPGNYVYRVVSRASPASVSPEYTLAVAGSSSAGGGEILGASVKASSNAAVLPGASDDVQQGSQDDVGGEPLASSSPPSDLANIFSAGLGDIPWYWFLIVLGLILVVYLIVRSVSKEK